MTGAGGTRRALAVALALALALLAALAWRAFAPPRAMPAPTRLALIVPDELAPGDVHVQAWRDAAAETGFALEVVRASALLRDDAGWRDAALVLPDTVHRVMGDALLARLDERVRDGAPLMLVHDAGVLDADGRFHPQRTRRLAALAGVDYALYDELRGDTVQPRVVHVDAAAVALLQWPPGRLLRAGGDRVLTSGQPAPRADEALAIAGYRYGRLRYPVFATRGAFDGRRLMHAEGGALVAGRRRLGAGSVLFVNLPLGALKLRTDGLPLHALLRVFAQDVAQLPQLSPVPAAQGAVIVNWHLDSSAALPALKTLEGLGVFEQGPYSVHLTAGPDVDVPGDGLGIDLPRSAAMRAWVRRFAARGDEVGSHGGWIHNAFGLNADRQDRALTTALVERNVAAVEDAGGRPVREYSAPLGNHPAWLTPWLRERGVLAYYFTGDGGMAPTRGYQDGVRGPDGVWSFPVLNHGALAVLEEAHAAGVPEDDVEAWLNDVSDYCAAQRTVRLVYFHPPGVAFYPRAFASWLRRSAALVQGGRLRWTTMAAHASFANQRLRARWEVAADDGGASSALRLRASHPQSLDRLAWLLPARRYDRPQVLAGAASVDLDGAYWRVVAGASARLELRLPLRAAAAAAGDAAVQASP